MRSDYPENPRRDTTALTRPEATHLLHLYLIYFVGTKLIQYNHGLNAEEKGSTLRGMR